MLWRVPHASLPKTDHARFVTIGSKGLMSLIRGDGSDNCLDLSPELFNYLLVQIIHREDCRSVPYSNVDEDGVDICVVCDHKGGVRGW